MDDFDNLQQLPHLAHINIKNNPITLSNKKQQTNSIDDIIRSDRIYLFLYGHSQSTETKRKHVFKLNVLFPWLIFLIISLFSMKTSP